VTSGKKIEIWTDELEAKEKAALPALGRRAIESVSVDMTLLFQNLKEFTQDFQAILDEQPQSPSGSYVDEIELSLGVNAKGGIAILGKIEAGVQGSIKIKLKRRL
jgi:hypothetical protein